MSPEFYSSTFKLTIAGGSESKLRWLPRINKLMTIMQLRVRHLSQRYEPSEACVFWMRPECTYQEVYAEETLALCWWGLLFMQVTHWFRLLEGVVCEAGISSTGRVQLCRVAWVNTRYCLVPPLKKRKKEVKSHHEKVIHCFFSWGLDHFSREQNELCLCFSAGALAQKKDTQKYVVFWGSHPLNVPRLFQQPLRLSHQHVSVRACFVIRLFPEWKLWQRMWQLHTRRTSERDHTHTGGGGGRGGGEAWTNMCLAPIENRQTFRRTKAPGKRSLESRHSVGLDWVGACERDNGGGGLWNKMWVTVREESESNNMLGEFNTKIASGFTQPNTFTYSLVHAFFSLKGWMHWECI